VSIATNRIEDEESRHTPTFLLRIILSCRTDDEHARKDSNHAAIKLNLIWLVVFDDREPIEEAMREFEKADHLIVIRRNLTEGLHDLAKGGEDESCWHSRWERGRCTSKDLNGVDGFLYQPQVVLEHCADFGDFGSIVAEVFEVRQC
jgi:hypothetical protein